MFIVVLLQLLDQNLLDPIFRLGISRRDRDIIEQAKAHGLVDPRVMPRRTDERKSPPSLLAHRRVYSRDSGTGRQQGGPGRFLRGVHVVSAVTRHKRMPPSAPLPFHLPLEPK